MGESDEQEKAEDNSLGRLLTLCDGIFAIAMTLLALDLTLGNDLPKHPSDADIRNALDKHVGIYLSFLFTFYVVGGYWGRHRRLMRSVVNSHPQLVSDTMILLLLVAAMPFPASLLGEYGDRPTVLALYGGINALAILTLIKLNYDVRHFDLVDHRAQVAPPSLDTWRNLAVFLLCIPAGYVLGRHGPWIFVLMAVPLAWPPWRRSVRGSGQLG